MQRIEVCTKAGLRDAVGSRLRKSIGEDLGIKLRGVRTIKAYSTDIPLSEKQAELAAEKAFSDSITQTHSVNSPLAAQFEFDWLLEVGFLPGVTDNEGRTAKESLKNLFGKEFKGSVFTSVQYLFCGGTKKEAEAIAEKMLANPLIEKWRVLSFEEWKTRGRRGLPLPVVTERRKPEVKEISLEMPDEKLEAFSESRMLALTPGELKIFREYFKKKETVRERKKFGLGNKPTRAELECFAQTQSEHCKHKIFNALITYTEEGRTHKIDSLLKTFIKGATEKIMQNRRNFCVSVFRDNAGIISFDENWNAAFKVETHNSPSALDPYGGALTGIVGVNRDILGAGLGARPIFNTDVLCFGSPFTAPKNVPETVLHPRRVFKGVRLGIEHGGNQMGIPTVNGTVYFDESFVVRPLVYCGTGGIIPARIAGKRSHLKKAMPGDRIVMVGGRIGKDGIHGATFSSVQLNEGSPATAVQIGAPLVQKRMQDMLLEARDMGLYNSITDNGAGGLSSSVGEMALQSNGALLQLENAPLKYPGLQPWEILLSEAQERMTLAVPKEKLAEFLELSKARGVEATVLGEFTNTGYFHVKYGKRSILFLSLEFLHNGIPQMELSAKWVPFLFEEPEVEEQDDYTETLKELLSHLNVCSKEWLVRQYDHEVLGTTIIKPLMGAFNDGPSDAAVLKPLHDSWRGIVVSNGINPRYGQIDAYHMAANCIDEAIRNAVASGASPERIALLDNFCWPDPKFHREKNPDGRKKLAQLVRACRACYETATEYSAPFISGKDSLAGDKEIKGKKYSIKPTLLVSALGITEDVRCSASIDAKQAGDLVYVLGETRNECGGSAFYELGEATGANVPKVNAKKFRELYSALSKAIALGLVQSCHDCSEGGLAVALAETAFSGMLGMNVDLGKAPMRGVEKNWQLLFSESPGRFVVTVRKEKSAEFERTLGENDFALVGEVIPPLELLVLGLHGNAVIEADIMELKECWQKTLKW